MEVHSFFEMAFQIVGGLGIFLLGMKNMSEGMQAVAGDKLRKLINAVTNNRFLACTVGTLVTCLIQSSSITTVMVVGMVNAGIMNLVQAIGVILGANIGTTITGWILVLKIGKYGLPIIGVSAIFFLFSKRDRVRFISTLFLGLGLVFFGLQLMKNGFSPLRENEAFLSWFSHFSPTDYFGVLKCCAVGAALTAIVQSSSATLGITISLAMVGVIDYPTAAALVLGENIGTTITAFLASIGASTNARRASMAHVIINIFGVIWVTAIFGVYTSFIVKYTTGSTGVTTDNIAKCIAATHTGFNLINVAILMPLIGIMAKLLVKIIPDKTNVPESHNLQYIDVRMLDTPSISIQQSKREIERMGDINYSMFNSLKMVFTNSSRKDHETIFEGEKKLDFVQKEITEFLSKTLTTNIPRELASQISSQLRMADEFETISDYITNILKLNLKIQDIDESISDDGLDELIGLHDHVDKYLHFIIEAVKNERKDILADAQVHGNAITHLMKEYRSRHLERVGAGKIPPLKSLAFTDILNSYRRIKDHAFNIAEVLAGEK